MSNDRDVVITGVGLLSSLGEGNDAHWDALAAGKPNIDTEAFAPFRVHPLAPVDFDKQIPKRNDQRQMEPWQRIGTYAAGLALEDAGVRNNEAILQCIDMMVAAGGGERDTAVDGAVLSDLRRADNPGRLLNERLMSDLRPTLLLAQLSNLLAGNISIVHGVVGSSRTFMGEEMAGVDVLRTAHARIASGQSEISLVGAAFNGERKDMILQFAFGNRMARGEHRSVWERSGNEAGMTFGSVGAFLVLESRQHATARGARIYGRLARVTADGVKPADGAFRESLRGFLSNISPAGGLAIVSGATGIQPETADEHAALDAEVPDAPVRATADMIGHSIEAQFPLNVALGALAVSRGQVWPDVTQPAERAADGLKRVIVTGRGQLRGIGLALIEVDR
jgi:3-oxoacyl-[acyl-carrier-protein] synthase II